jgi:hypothetical protein
VPAFKIIMLVFGVAPSLIMLIFLVWYCWNRKTENIVHAVHMSPIKIKKGGKQKKVIPFNEIEQTSDI